MLPGGALTLAVWFAATPAAAPGLADEPPIRVDFDAPAGCADAAAFTAGVLARVDRAHLDRAAAAAQGGLRFRIRLSRGHGGVHGELRLVDQRGATETRKVDGATCQEVVEVLSLTAALAIDPSSRGSAGGLPAAVPGVRPSDAAAARVPPLPGAPPPARPAAAAGTAAPPPAPGEAAAAPRSGVPEMPAVGAAGSQPRGASRRLMWGFGLQTVAARILSPSVTVGAAAVLQVRARRTDAGGAPASVAAPSLSVALLHVRNDLVQTPDEVAAHWTGASLTACPGWGFGHRVVVEPCAVGMGGWLTAEERAVSNPLSAGRTWLSAGAMLRATMPLGGGFALRVEAGAAVALAKRTFVTSTPDRTVAETTAVAPLVGLGMGYGL
jgi:hypothetical protein